MTQQTAESWTYRDAYLKDESLIDTYAKYSEKYIQNPRESDKAIAGIINRHNIHGRRYSLVDIGCFTGNLLLYLKHCFPAFELHGWDIVPQVIKANKLNEILAEIEFEEMDICNTQSIKKYDFVVTNAVLGTLEDLKKPFLNIADILADSGTFICFDWFHPYDHDLQLTERSRLFPHGVKSYFRSYNTVSSLLRSYGFEDIQFYPFNIGIDLPKPESSGPHTLVSYTVKTTDNFRLSFKGAIYQPWCHLVARKK